MTIIVPARPERPIVVEGQSSPSISVTGGRTLPPGGSAGQALVKASGSDFATEWSDIIASASWGAVTGTLSAQLDLQAALDAKQATLVSGTNIKTLNGSTILGSGDLIISASASWGGITGTLSSQTDLQSALDGKQPLATVLTNTTASFTTAQETKLAGIATAATANASDAALRDRSTHTGTQLASTISDSTTAGRAVLTAATATAQTALFDVFTTSAKGLAPASGGGTTNFLRADGTWAAPPGGAGISDGDKGDITVASSGTVWTVDAGSITLAKMADIATDSFIGRDTAGTGVPEVLSAATARTILNVANGATANASDASLRDRATHTGTQLASTISDFATAVAATAAVTANTAKVTNATHTGDVTGATALTIANDAVSNAKMANMATATIKGRVTAGTGDPEDLTPAQARTVIEVPKITVGTTAPGSPSVGDVWIDTN